jgi:hypothetical protein
LSCSIPVIDFVLQKNYFLLPFHSILKSVIFPLDCSKLFRTGVVKLHLPLVLLDGLKRITDVDLSLLSDAAPLDNSIFLRQNGLVDVFLLITSRDQKKLIFRRCFGISFLF